VLVLPVDIGVDEDDELAVRGVQRRSTTAVGTCPHLRCVARIEEERGKKMTSPSDRWVLPVGMMPKRYLGQAPDGLAS
jgi:hypothetical protein